MNLKQQIIAGLAWMARAIRAPVLCLIASLAAVLISQQGWLHRFELALSDHATFQTKVRPDNSTVIVTVNAATIAAYGRYPYDRTLIARLLEMAGEAGARRIYFDASLNYAEDAAGDDALEHAMSRLGPRRIALPVTRIGRDANGPTFTRPLPRFARHATPVLTEYVFDSDGRARRVGTVAEESAPLAAAWLAGVERDFVDRPLRIDFAIDAARLTHVPLHDLLEGRIAPELFAGRNVVIGLDVAASQTRVLVPAYGLLPRVDTLALGVETLERRREIATPDRTMSVLLTAGATLLFATVILKMGLLAGLLFWVGTLAGWLIYLEKLQLLVGSLLPAIAPPMAMFIVWQAMKFRDSAVQHWLSRQWMRLAGVGKSALVAAVDVVAGPAVVFDARGRVLGANEAFVALAGQITGVGSWKTFATLADIFPDAAPALVASSAEPAQSRFELSATLDTGLVRHHEASVRWVDTMTGRMAIAGFKDVTEARERELSLTNLAFRDALTGLANRVAFAARLDKLGAEQAEFGLLLIDLDGFKKINDTLGHHAGDLILQGVAGRIAVLLRPQDFAARLGGDEFAVIVLSGDESAAILVAERLLAALREPFDLEGTPGSVGASIGIALGPRDHRDAHEVLKLADAAMYYAKKVKPAYALHRGEAPADVFRSAA